jgi:hypothetical protein
MPSASRTELACQALSLPAQWPPEQGRSGYLHAATRQPGGHARPHGPSPMIAIRSIIRPLPFWDGHPDRPGRGDQIGGFLRRS